MLRGARGFWLDERLSLVLAGAASAVRRVLGADREVLVFIWFWEMLYYMDFNKVEMMRCFGAGDDDLVAFLSIV